MAIKPEQESDEEDEEEEESDWTPTLQSRLFLQ